MPYILFVQSSDVCRSRGKIPRCLVSAQWMKGWIHSLNTHFWLTCHVPAVGDLEVNKTKLLLSEGLLVLWGRLSWDEWACWAMVSATKTTKQGWEDRAWKGHDSIYECRFVCLTWSTYFPRKWWQSRGGNQVSRFSNPKIGLDASEQSGPYFSAFHMTSVVPEKVLTIFSLSLPCTLYILKYKSCTWKAYCHFAIGVFVLLNIPCFINGI